MKWTGKTIGAAWTAGVALVFLLCFILPEYMHNTRVFVLRSHILIMTGFIIFLFLLVITWKQANGR